MTRFALAAVLLLSATPAFASDETDIVAAINKMNDAMNKNDMKAAGSLHNADAVIVDEIPPYAWTGNGTFDRWSADYDKYIKAHGDTEPVVTTGKALHVLVEGDKGYAVISALYTYKEHGKKVRENALWTFAMQKMDGAWKIAAWTWSPR